ncbi:MAG: MiaB/RimO family radical SAM methylthiotransferase [Deltaproteobacteria bacterium]|jgi:MiaB/RimO family radical SAM methylthiotransferase|nr:MiaB/RimO family radical SAM methylthiotransferase [Deltaproteobacteria bacterium]
MTDWTFFIATFGCKVNQYESQALCEAWEKLGGRRLPAPAGADAVLVNSCAVTAKAERDARNAMYRLRREAPQARRLLTGCAACLADGALRESDRPHALIPQEAKSLLLQGPWVENSGRPRDSAAFPAFSISSFTRARPVLKVQDGCSHRCTFCIVPLTRGPARSRDPLAVREETQRLLAAGFRELMLSGINLGQYGRDFSTPFDFWDLLRMLEKDLAPRWAGLARLRVSSLEPGQLNAKGLDFLAASRLLCPHLHVSLQSGSPEILRRMGRGQVRLERLADALQRLRALWPVMGLGADMLTGFPGETDAQAEESVDVVETLGLSYAHVFPYSRRPGTAAAEMPGQLAQKEKAARAWRLREAVAVRQRAFLHTLLALPELRLHPDGTRALKGVDEHYAPCRLSEGRARSGHELLPVRPVRVEGCELVVEPL